MATRKELEARIAKLRKDLEGTVPQDRFQRTTSMAQRQMILDEIRYCNDELKKIDSEERAASRVVSRVEDKTIAQTLLEGEAANTKKSGGRSFEEMGRRRVKVKM